MKCPCCNAELAGERLDIFPSVDFYSCKSCGFRKPVDRPILVPVSEKAIGEAMSKAFRMTRDGAKES